MSCISSCMHSRIGTAASYHFNGFAKNSRQCILQCFLYSLGSWLFLPSRVICTHITEDHFVPHDSKMMKISSTKKPCQFSQIDQGMGDVDPNSLYQTPRSVFSSRPAIHKSSSGNCQIL